MQRSGGTGQPRAAVAPMVGATWPRDLLGWIYLGRVAVAIVVFVAAAFSFRAVPPETIVILAVAAIASVIASGLSVWYTHVRRSEPNLTFLYLQALFDLALVTTVVHVTEGPDSQFPALYILVIAVSAVLMPLASSLLVTSLAILLYLADIVWWQPVQLSLVVWLQIAVFVAVFVATGLIASRVRVMGAEREELEQEVHRLRLEASDILQNIRSGVLTVDGDGRLLFANPAACELLGLDQQTSVDRPLDELIGDRAVELLQAIAVTRSTRHKSVRSEGEVRVGDRQFPIGVTTTSIDTPDSASPSVTAIFTDISDQKRIEALRLRTERLEAVAELSASLAHEIKNPLASIRSSIEQLAGNERQGEDERHLTRLVIRESDRLSRLLTEFLDFSRVRVTQGRPFDLVQVVEAAVAVVRKHPDCPEDAKLRIVVKTPPPVEGDEDLLHRVVVNLVLNAVQASTDTPEVLVEVREARPDDVPMGVRLGTAVLLSITDDGPGIPEELRDRLFEPFVSGRTGGSGLGLAIVQRAVQAHRGLLFLDSRPGAGTTFSIVIPAAGPAEVSEDDA